MQMAQSFNKNDRKLVALISEYKVLTVKQLSALSQRSLQVVRRRNRAMEMEGLLATQMQGYGRGRGRPEEVVFLTEKAEALLGDERSNCMGKVDPFTDHHLLVNWFRIHLLQIERSIPELSVKYLDSKLQSKVWNSAGSSSAPKRTPANKRGEKSGEFIPDGVFSITNKETEKKTLLFFLEVDMGTETIASQDRSPKDIRQKILNYQTLFQRGEYKRYESLFDSRLNGFRLLFLVNSPTRLISLCRLVRETPPSDFVWLTEQQQMFSHGLSARIWARGGRNEDLPQSILGHGLSCELPLLEISDNPLIIG